MSSDLRTMLDMHVKKLRGGRRETNNFAAEEPNRAQNLEESEYSATAERAKLRDSADVCNGEASELWTAKIAIVTL